MKNSTLGKFLPGLSGILLSLTSITYSYSQCQIPTASAPTVDNTIEAIWSSTTAHNINMPMASTSTPTGFSAQWRSLYTTSNLYFLFEVTKTGSLYNQNGGNWWNDDAVEVYLDGDHSAGSSYDHVNDCQYGFRYNDGTAVKTGANSITSTTGITYNFYTTSVGYNVEISIPWSTISTTPTAGNVVGIEAGVDVSNGTRMTQMSTYNNSGFSYNNPSLFGSLTLSSCFNVATLSTTAISGTTSTTASSGGNVSNDGGAAVTARGVCWGTSTGPTVAGSKTTDGTGTGTFTSALSGLLPNTTYYVKAYATNSEGTAYGNEVSFTTSAGMSTGVINGLSDDGISLYPNPSSGIYHLDIDQMNSSFIEINIKNAEGKTVYSKRIENAGTSLHESFDLTGKKGIYLIEIISDNTILKDKVVVY
jgi:hypothetical protein